MVTIVVLDGKLFLHDTEIQFPASVSCLKDAIGGCRYTKTIYNNIYTWDELGIAAYSQNGDRIESISVCCRKNDFEFSPKQAFGGVFLFEGVLLHSYLAANKGKLVKLFKGDAVGAFVSGRISVWFGFDDGVIDVVQIGIYETPKQKKVPKPLAVDDGYRYLEPLWLKWIEQVSTVIKPDDNCYNLTQGITQKDIKKHSRLKGDIVVPDELINFYKIHNVEYSGATSAFGFFVNGIRYDLIPFEDIASHWRDIADLTEDFDGGETDFSGYNHRVKADGYASLRWIPFANGHNGDYLLYDTDPFDGGIYGQIIELQNESWERNIAADSLSELLRKEIESILSGDIEALKRLLG